jgi:hypothetical protein
MCHMFAPVVIGGLGLNRHEPRCTSRIESDACGANGCPRTLQRNKSINVPKERLVETVWEHLGLNNAATNLTAALRRVLNAGSHQLRYGRLGCEC